MNFLWAGFVVVTFVVVLERLDLPARAVEVAHRSRGCLEVLRDPALSDDQKEAALQRQARRLFALLGILMGGSALALGLPLAAVLGLDWIGWASFSGVWDTLQRLDFLGAVSVGGGIFWLVLQKRG